MCTPEVERARWLVAQLAYLAPEAEPPAALRRRVIEAVASAPRAERRAWFPAWAWAAAAALLLLAVFSVYWTRRLEAELGALRNQIRKEQSQARQLESEKLLYQQALAILAARTTKEVTLKPAAAAALPEVRAYWNAELGLVVAAGRVPAPAPDRTFQLWVVPKKGNPVSAGIFRPDERGRVLVVSTPGVAIGESAALAITDEPAGGRPQPTTKPLWIGPVG